MHKNNVGDVHAFAAFGRCLLGGCASVLLAGLTGCTSLPLSEPPLERAAKILEYRETAARLRGLPMTQEVSVERETPEALQASLSNELDKSENRVFFGETELLLRQFRCLGPDVTLRSLYLKVMGEQVAAYYDPAKKRLAYVDENVAAGGKKKKPDLSEMQRFVYVHEFCHAIEDGHFDLDHLTKESMSDLDRSLALTCFAEGNAVLMGVDALLDGYGFPMNTATPFNAWLVSLLRHMDMAETIKEMEGVPPFLAATLLRPYLDGTVFSNRIRRDTGWQGIDTVYRSRIPLTTAEILYPERRYLKGFRPAAFEPDPQLFKTARRGVSVNSVGALGIAMWLGGDQACTVGRFPFLKGWMGDRVFFLKGEGNVVQTVWLSTWERPGLARAFSWQVERHLKKEFGDVPWVVRREGRLVAAVWTSAEDAEGLVCQALSDCALRTRVEVETGSTWASWSKDLPSPVRFPVFEGYSSGCEVLGGYAADVQGGPAFFRLSLAGGLVLRAETNEDRHYYGMLGGLLRHVEDGKSDFTSWKVPLLASWHRRGQGDGQRFRWSLLWGLLSDGNEQRVRVLFVPVWQHE